MDGSGDATVRAITEADVLQGRQGRSIAESNAHSPFLESKHTKSCNSTMSFRAEMHFSGSCWGRNGWEGLVLC